MHEIKNYKTITELISDTRKWLDQNYQNYPFRYSVIENANSLIDFGNGTTIEESIEYIASNIIEYIGTSKSGFTVLRKNKDDKVEYNQIVFMVAETSKYNSIKEEVQSIDDFVGKYNDQLIVMFDGRYLLNNKPEYFDDDCFLSEKEPSKFQALDNEIFKLYNTCQKD